MVDFALRTFVYDKLRAAITVIGVAFAVLLVLIQVGLFVGLTDNATILVNRIDADVWVTAHNTSNVDFGQTFPESYVERVRSIPGVARADNLIVYYTPIALPSGAQETAEFYALEDFRRWGVPWHVQEGSADNLRGHFITLDEASERRLGSFRIGDYREVGGIRMRVVARTSGAESFTTTPLLFMDYRVAQEIIPSLFQGRTNFMLVRIDEHANVRAVMRDIHRRLPFNDVWTREGWAFQSAFYWMTTTGIGLNTILTIFLASLVAVVIVAQTLYAATMERLPEYGTIKALGGSNADIYAILAKQSLVAAVLGFILGALPTLSMRPLLAQAGLKFIVPPVVPPLVAVAAIALCLLSSIMSFRRVARIDPAMVFRT